MKLFMQICMSILILSSVVCGQDTPPAKPIADIKISNKKFLYIGFEKNTTESQRQSILNKASTINIEELTLLEYPLFRMEFADDEEGIRSFNEAFEQLENEPGVMFVSDKQNWDKDEFKSNRIKRQGEMGIPDAKKLPESSKANYHRIILNHMPGLNRCVVKEYPLERRKKIKALYEIVVNKKGAVEQVRLLSSNIKKPALRNCLKNKILTWHDFPRRTESENYKVKFKFSY